MPSYRNQSIDLLSKFAGFYRWQLWRFNSSLYAPARNTEEKYYETSHTFKFSLGPLNLVRMYTNQILRFPNKYHMLWFINICSWNWTDSFQVCKHNQDIRKKCRFHNVVFIKWKTGTFSKIDAKSNSVIVGKFESSLKFCLCLILDHLF